MKTQEEIKNNMWINAHEYGSTKYRIKDKSTFHKYEEVLTNFVAGYTQCQEDMQKDVEYWQGEFDHWHQQAMEMADKKYTEENLENAFNSGRGHGVPDNIKDFDSFINSLNKQD